MPYYPVKDYEFIALQKSTRKHKKYAALIKSKKTGTVSKIHFGDSRYQHFKDRTKLGLYINTHFS